MPGFRFGTLAALVLVSCTSFAAADEYGDRSWVRSFTQAYRDPANYPGRSVYSGSRYGFHGYTRYGAGTDPFPRSVRKSVPPTMYFWSKSASQGAAFQHEPASANDSASGAYDYYAE